MGTFLRLLLGLCTLHLFVSSDTIVDASRTPWTTAKNRYSIFHLTTFCIYTLIAFIYHIPYTMGFTNGTKIIIIIMWVRRARAVNKPTPIDCRLGSWSSWTPCDSCTDRKVIMLFFTKHLNMINVVHSVWYGWLVQYFATATFFQTLTFQFVLQSNSDHIRRVNKVGRGCTLSPMFLEVLL